jgi:hypothetical protein
LPEADIICPEKLTFCLSPTNSHQNPPISNQKTKNLSKNPPIRAPRPRSTGKLTLSTLSPTPISASLSRPRGHIEGSAIPKAWNWSGRIPSASKNGSGPKPPDPQNREGYSLVASKPKPGVVGRAVRVDGGPVSRPVLVTLPQVVEIGTATHNPIAATAWPRRIIGG